MEMKIGGKKEHIALVKLATKKVIDDFADRLEGFKVSFEEKHFGFDFKIARDQWSMTHGSFTFKPDIVAWIEPRKDITFGKDRGRWKSIIDSRCLIFEVETNPRKIFRDILKIEAYRRVKSSDYGRGTYAFILVCWREAKLPDIVEPFDEVWRFDRLSVNGS